MKYLAGLLYELPASQLLVKGYSNTGIRKHYNLSDSRLQYEYTK